MQPQPKKGVKKTVRPLTDVYMPCIWSEASDQSHRLTGGFCRYNGEPVYVSNVDSQGIMINPMNDYYGNPLKQSLTEAKYVSHKDPNLDVSSPELGYFLLTAPPFYDGPTILYAERHPYRKYHQSLTQYSCTVRMNNGKNASSSMMSSQEFFDLLAGVPPTFDLSEELGVMSRDFCFETDKFGQKFLFFKRNKVGKINHDLMTGEVKFLIFKSLRSFLISEGLIELGFSPDMIKETKPKKEEGESE
ncbi:MAG: hypothetical protein AB7V06_25630 [Candidatus Obscuribacterales bacterium]